MWLTQQLNARQGAEVTSGQVAGGEVLSIRGDKEYRCPESLFPYGFSSLAVQGRRAVMLDGLCLGLSDIPDSDLEEGEVRLYSAGGAEILLKNTGEVVVNGRTFAAR